MSEQQYDKLDDDELINACREASEHNQKPFEALVRRHEAMVYRVCLRILGREADANDVSQEVFLRVYRHLGRFEGRSTFKTWLMTITRNECFSFAAKNRDNLLTSFDGSEPVNRNSMILPENPVERQYLASDLVAKTLDQLSSSDREVLVLRYVAELSLNDISETMELSLSATKMRLYRAIERFTELSGEKFGLNGTARGRIDK